MRDLRRKDPKRGDHLSVEGTTMIFSETAGTEEIWENRFSLPKDKDGHGCGCSASAGEEDREGLEEQEKRERQESKRCSSASATAFRGNGEMELNQRGECQSPNLMM